MWPFFYQLDTSKIAWQDHAISTIFQTRRGIVSPNSTKAKWKNSLNICIPKTISPDLLRCKTSRVIIIKAHYWKSKSFAIGEFNYTGYFTFLAETTLFDAWLLRTWNRKRLCYRKYFQLSFIFVWINITSSKLLIPVPHPCALKLVKLKLLQFRSLAYLGAV